ncbi:UNVERIFIED_CONTAM: hypothetical protein K2H54_006837 [Gekko kuhli]
MPPCSWRVLFSLWLAYTHTHTLSHFTFPPSGILPPPPNGPLATNGFNRTSDSCPSSRPLLTVSIETEPAASEGPLQCAEPARGLPFSFAGGKRGAGRGRGVSLLPPGPLLSQEHPLPDLSPAWKCPQGSAQPPPIPGATLGCLGNCPGFQPQGHGDWCCCGYRHLLSAPASCPRVRAFFLPKSRLLSALSRSLKTRTFPPFQ